MQMNDVEKGAGQESERKSAKESQQAMGTHLLSIAERGTGQAAKDSQPARGIMNHH
jgi:hypothetical protein